MKLSKREVFLLKLVGFVALVALSYYFVIAPELDKLAIAGEELAAKALEVESVKAEIQSIPELEVDIDILKEDIVASAGIFYPEIQQKKLIVILDQQLRESGASSDSLGFSQLVSVESPSADIPDQEGEQNDDTEDVSDLAEPMNLDIQTMSIQAPLYGSYEQIMDFIGRIEGLNRTILINSLQLTQGMDGMISGTINLDFYSLNKLTENQQDEDYLNWPYNTSKGIDNPFQFQSSESLESVDDPGLEENTEQDEELTGEENTGESVDAG